MFNMFHGCRLLLALLLLHMNVRAEYHAKSYSHFKGPVEGPVKQVILHGHGGHDHHGGEHVIDYVADPKYKFAYGVVDLKHGDFKSHKEIHDGHRVIGEYSLQEPGGNIRTVKYISDENGFQAEVHNSGENTHTGGYHHHNEELSQPQYYAGVQPVAILSEQSQY